MNRYTKHFLLIIILLFLISCSNKIVIQRINADEPVVVKMNLEQKIVTGIKFPFYFLIQNQSFKKQKFGRIIYEYSYKEKGAGIELYEDNIDISNNQLKVVCSNESKYFLIYFRHFTDFTDFTQQQLKPYVEKMLELNQDTLHIGTVSEFKEKHAELFKMLTENDTISIRYLKGKNAGLGERIAIPANW